jgi:hypothetical protein
LRRTPPPPPHPLRPAHPLRPPPKSPTRPRPSARARPATGRRRGRLMNTALSCRGRPAAACLPFDQWSNITGPSVKHRGCRSARTASGIPTRHGPARPGTAWPGPARPGTARWDDDRRRRQEQVHCCSIAATAPPRQHRSSRSTHTHTGSTRAGALHSGW